MSRTGRGLTTRLREPSSECLMPRKDRERGVRLPRRYGAASVEEITRKAGDQPGSARFHLGGNGTALHRGRGIRPTRTCLEGCRSPSWPEGTPAVFSSGGRPCAGSCARCHADGGERTRTRPRLMMREMAKPTGRASRSSASTSAEVAGVWSASGEVVEPGHAATRHYVTGFRIVGQFASSTSRTGRSRVADGPGKSFDKIDAEQDRGDITAFRARFGGVVMNWVALKMLTGEPQGQILGI